MSDDKNARSGQRSYVTRTIKKAKHIIRNFEETNRFRLEGIWASLKEKSDVLKELDVKILATLDEDVVDNKIDSSIDFSLEILEIIFEIDSVLRKVSKGKKSSLQGNHNATFSSLITNLKASLKLPNLNVKHFSGNPLEFQGFLDSFKTAIHENDNIPPTGCISGLNLTVDNYKQALDAIVQCYGKRKLLISIHIDQLLSIKPILNLYDVKKLRKTFDEIESNVRNLKVLNIDPEQYGPVLVSIIMSKLPNKIRLLTPLSPEWDVEIVINHFQRELESREMCEFLASTNSETRDQRYQQNET